MFFTGTSPKLSITALSFSQTQKRSGVSLPASSFPGVPCNSLLSPNKRCNTEGQRLRLNVANTELRQMLRQLFRLVELQHALRQIVVCQVLIFGKPLPQPGQDSTKVKPVTMPQNRQRRYRKIQHSNGSLRLAYPKHFGKSLLVIANVPQSKSNGNNGKPVVLKRQAQRIAHRKVKGRIVFYFPLSNFDHLWGKVNAVIRPLDAVFLLFHESERKIAGTAANVQNVSFGDVLMKELPGGECPPRAVDTKRKKVIHQIVSGRNRTEHSANAFRRLVHRRGTTRIHAAILLQCCSNTILFPKIALVSKNDFR